MATSEHAPADPRSLLAVERTMLAWLRTGISLITFGFLIAKIGVWLEGQKAGEEMPGSVSMGALFVIMGAVANLLALIRFLQFRHAILTSNVAPTSRLALSCFAGSVTLLGAALGAVVLSHLRF
jgi:putative membrane protein